MPYDPVRNHRAFRNKESLGSPEYLDAPTLLRDARYDADKPKVISKHRTA